MIFCIHCGRAVVWTNCFAELECIWCRPLCSHGWHHHEGCTDDPMDLEAK